MSSLSKMLSVLDLFGPATLKIDPDTIAERMGLSRATVYRYVKDLSLIHISEPTRPY